MKALPAPWAMMMAKAINAQIMDTAAAGARAMTDSRVRARDRKSTRLNSSHGYISYAVFCLKKKKIKIDTLAFNDKSIATFDSSTIVTLSAYDHRISLNFRHFYDLQPALDDQACACCFD